MPRRRSAASKRSSHSGQPGDDVGSGGRPRRAPQPRVDRQLAPARRRRRARRARSGGTPGCCACSSSTGRRCTSRSAKTVAVATRVHHPIVIATAATARDPQHGDVERARQLGVPRRVRLVERVAVDAPVPGVGEERAAGGAARPARRGCAAAPSPACSRAARAARRGARRAHRSAAVSVRSRSRRPSPLRSTTTSGSSVLCHVVTTASR